MLAQAASHPAWGRQAPLDILLENGGEANTSKIDRAPLGFEEGGEGVLPLCTIQYMSVG